MVRAGSEFGKGSVDIYRGFVHRRAREGTSDNVAHVKDCLPGSCLRL